MALSIDFNKLIPNKAMPFVNAFFTGEHIEYSFTGGRACAKTRIACYLILIAIMSGWGNAVCIRRFKTSLRYSCFNALRNTINFLKLGNLFTYKVNPLEITCKHNGYKVYFVGLDDPEKSKGFEADNGDGYYCCWFEEANTFESYSDMRSIYQTFSRIGGSHCRSLITFNPPNSITHWANVELRDVLPDDPTYRTHLHMTYLDIPKEWLSDQFRRMADMLKVTNKQAYEHEYMGVVNATGGNLFQNVVRDTDGIFREMFNSTGAFDYPLRGIDWGFKRDAMVSIKAVYSKELNAIYIDRSFYKYGGCTLDALTSFIDETNEFNSLMYADCADGGMIGLLRDRGYNITECQKPHDCISYGVKWIQSLSGIYMSADVDDDVYKLLKECQYQQDREGSFLPDFPKSSDRCWDVIDAIRYTFDPVLYGRW